MFVGRRDELKELNDLYDSGKFECVIVHGRLRVGKTTLLREFTKDKRFIYFAAQETSSRENLRHLTSCIDVFSPEPAAREQGKNNYAEMLDRVFWLSCTERLVFIIDDYEFLTAAHKGISELIRGHIDQWFVDSKLMLIICGSSEPVMEKETLGFDSPFKEKRTAQIQLRPFTFFETKRYYSGFAPFDIALIYGMTGGVPGYLELMDPEASIEHNILRAFFDPTSLLFEEPINIMRREFRDPGYNSAVLKALAAGYTKNADIAEVVGFEPSACAVYLKNLITLGFVCKHTPATEKAGKLSAFEIKDNMFRFWYRFVPDNLSLIQGGLADKVWHTLARDISAYMQKIFEDICRQWIEQRNGSDRLPVRFTETGRWWSVDASHNTEVSIPIVAFLDESHALFGDCTWSDAPVGADVLVSLEERSRAFHHPNKFFYLFSRSGFSDECTEMAHHMRVDLVLFE